METLALLGGSPEVAEPPVERWPLITEEDIAAVTELLRNGEISYTGREGHVRELEEEFARYLGARHALAVNSGTSALHSAFFGLDLEPGDEVLAPTYTFLATVMPVFAVNAVPVLVDVDPETGNVDPSRLAAHLTERTRAIVVTHLNGYPVDMNAVMSFSREHGLKVVEDCSQAHGAECDGRRIGTFGDAAAFSLQAKKQVTAGSGGVLVTNDRLVLERAVMLGHFLDRAEADVTDPAYRPFARTGFGLNLRMHPAGAVLARGSLSRLEEVLKVRQLNCDHLDGLLSDIPGIKPPVRRPHMTRVAHYSYQPLYQAQELGGLSAGKYVEALAAEGVPVTRPQSPPLHQEPAFQRAEWSASPYGPHGSGAGYRHYRDGDFPDSTRYVEAALRLPVFSHDVRAELDRFAAAMRKVARHADRITS